MSFESIYQEHKELVYNLALQYVQNHEDAQEIAQDVFVSIHQKLDTFNQQSKLSTWIYRITINRSFDYIRSKKRKKRWGFLTALFDEDGETSEADRPVFDHPGVQLEQKESLARIFACINKLPDNQRTALILSKIEQKPHAEIAEIMDLTQKAVESLVQRAKVSLQKKLDTEGI